MRNILYTFSSILALMACSAVKAQSNEVVISGTRVVDSSETFTMKPGQTLVFDGGARLLIYGGLEIKGTRENPVKIISRNKDNPGLGIVIADFKAKNPEVIIENVKFSGLVQAIRFDPFWYRKLVKLDHVEISNFELDEPLIYSGNPLLDLRDNKAIDFELTNSHFFNNKGNVILENVGSLGINYVLNNLTFNDNILNGENVSMGILHLDFSRTLNQDRVSLGDLTFVNNTSGNKIIGLSVSGGSGVVSEISSGKIFSNSPSSQVIFDNRSDARLPKIGVSETTTIKDKGGDEIFITGATHKFGRLALEVVGQPQIVDLRDSFGRSVFISQTIIGDSLIANYVEGNPVILTLQNGLKYNVPKLTAAELPLPLYRRVDTTFVSNNEWMDNRWKTWMEYGIWTGGAIYQGDFKHKFTVMPSTIELSTGLYAQFKPFKRTAFRATYYNARISMHSILAPGLFSGMVTPKFPTTLSKGGFFEPTNVWRFNFTTNLNILDVEALFYLNRARNINFANDKRWTMLSMIGIGSSLIHFVPQRMVVTDVYTLVPLRPLGTEGQNFLPGKKPYSVVTGSLNLAYNMVFQKNRWVIKGEIKKVYSFSDYLDDWGSGQWYGGDFDKWRASLPQGNIDPFSGADMGYLAGLGEYYQVEYKDAGLDLSAKKSLTSLPDGFLQFHLGVAYRIVNPEIKEKKKKEIKDSLK